MKPWYCIRHDYKSLNIIVNIKTSEFLLDNVSYVHPQPCPFSYVYFYKMNGKNPITIIVMQNTIDF